MPPINKYVFKHKVSNIITITLEIYGDMQKAWDLLGNYVLNKHDWELHD